jgi:hypothetical protein
MLTHASKTLQLARIPGKQKNPAAVALGRLGASKGGKARAMLLSQEERIAIAKRAALARWGER